MKKQVKINVPLIVDLEELEKKPLIIKVMVTKEKAPTESGEKWFRIDVWLRLIDISEKELTEE